MVDESHLDGNAVGGLLFDLFGREMTGQLGCCGGCGSVTNLGAIHVYREAPGDVMRCPNCGIVLLVIVPREVGFRISLESLRWIEVS